jgi:Chaperone of endosialidase/Collagen triple helix repeat (20 copies)/YadA head domain repeat (2 copies)
MSRPSGFLHLVFVLSMILALGLLQGCSCDTEDETPDEPYCFGGDCPDTDDDDDASGDNGPVIQSIIGNSSDQPGRIANGIIITGKNLGTLEKAGSNGVPTVTVISQDDPSLTGVLEIVSANESSVEAKLFPELESWVEEGKAFYTVTLSNDVGKDSKEDVNILQGEQGVSGPQGPSGPEGPIGPPGITGDQGAMGPTGPSGPQGLTGTDGAMGPSGPAGADGATGPTGADGATGPSGPTGADGATGPSGPAGADGATGPSGPAGADGATGPSGPAGADGATGPSGPAGADGATGPSGPSGPTLWTQTGSDIYYNDGNVGIGDDTPDYLFEVNLSESAATGVKGIVMGGGDSGSPITAEGDFSMATGLGTTASGYASAAMGEETTASGNRSIATGNDSIASGHNSVAMGNDANASEYVSVALGDNTTASGTRSSAIGYRTTASGSFSTAMGNATSATASSSTSMGYNTTASGTTSIAMGQGTTASGKQSIAMGREIEAQGDYSFGIGLQDFAAGSEPVIVNDSVMAIMGGAGVGIETVDPKAELHVNGSVIVGNQSLTCAADTAGAMQYNAGNYFEYCDGTSWSNLQGADGADGATGPTGPTGADGAQGPSGPAGADGADGATGATGPSGPAGADGADGPSGPSGPSLWTQNSADIYYNDGNVGIGDDTPDYLLEVNLSESGATGVKGIALGGGNASYAIAAEGDYSLATGYGTTASGDYSTATGYRTTASGKYSTAIGSMAVANNLYSTAIGAENKASGVASTSIGYQTTASGDSSTAMGRDVKVSGKDSFGIGLQDFGTTPNISRTNVMAIMGGDGVGVDTIDPKARLHVNGEIIVGNSGLGCSADAAGAIRYNSGALQVCNGSSWSATKGGSISGPAESLPHHSLPFDLSWAGGFGGANSIDSTFVTQIASALKDAGVSATIDPVTGRYEFEAVKTWSEDEDGITYTEGDVTIGSENDDSDLILYGQFESFDDVYVHGDTTLLASLEVGQDYQGEYALSVHGAGFASDGWYKPSDLRLKKDVEPLYGALDAMLQLHGVSYEWRDASCHDDQRHLGMIAQQVERVFPEWVKTDPGGFKALSYEGFEALTVEAIRELKAENDALREKIEELDEVKSELVKIKAMLKEMKPST